MNAFERYLSAVRSNLPRDQRDDIVAELTENLQDRFADRAAELGRPLTDAEQDAILKDHGHPIAVAARYRGDDASLRFGRQLIGPELFPLYTRVLAINVAITVVLGAVLAIVLAGGGEAGPAVYGLGVPLIIQFLVVTGIFVFVDRQLAAEIAAGRWDPRTVGPIDDYVPDTGLDSVAQHLVGPLRRHLWPRVASLWDLAVAAIGIVVWLALPQYRTIGFVEAGPGIIDLYLPILVLAAASLVQPAVNLVEPGWIRFRSAARAVVDAGFTIAFLVSLGIGRWVVPAAGVTGADELATIDAINEFIRIGLAISVVLTGAMAAFELRRLVQLSRPDGTHERATAG